MKARRHHKKRENNSPFFASFLIIKALTMRKLILFLVLTGLYGCNGGVVNKLLESSSLGAYAIVQDWKQAGETVLNDSLEVALPYQEIGYFDPKQAKAMLLRYPVQEGHQINVVLDPVSQKDAVIFMDIFEVDPLDSSLERIHYADSSGVISYQVRDSGIHALRLQPELFRGGVFSVSITAQGLLAFPIVGKGTRNIASFWGDPRDGDARKHEGVDVFASRGTPVVAASPGRIRRVGDNRLGGKVVWLSNNELGQSQYYAHLDSQLVSAGQLVKVGDTLGLVGNTGNAITTAPHLHFGIYRSGRGAVDPLPFLQELVLPEETEMADSLYLGRPARIAAASGNIRESPGTSSARVGSYGRNTLVRLEGKSGSWYRISLPSGQKAYIFENLVEVVGDALQTVQLSALDEVWEYRDAPGSITGAIIAGEASVFGEFEGSYFLETANGIQGWWGFK
jgi:murein DD-endopeptidase MepM/ murein hydrolase activator NlpD